MRQERRRTYPSGLRQVVEAHEKCSAFPGPGSRGSNLYPLKIKYEITEVKPRGEEEKWGTSPFRLNLIKFEAHVLSNLNIRSLWQRPLFCHSRESGNLELLESRRWRDWIPGRALLARNDEFPFMWGVLQETYPANEYLHSEINLLESPTYHTGEFNCACRNSDRDHRGQGERQSAEGETGFCG